jgi:FMN phosphatase YigB (HAD superfamily)
MPLKVVKQNDDNPPAMQPAAPSYKLADKANLVFDIGNVLLRYRPLTLCELCSPSEAVTIEMYNLIFRSPEWNHAHEGRFTHEGLYEIFSKRKPQYAEYLDNFFEIAPDYLYSRSEGAAELVRNIKKDPNIGGIFFIDNMHKEVWEQVREDHEEIFLILTSGMLSFSAGLSLPNQGFFIQFLKEKGLHPDTCTYFSSHKENISVAEHLGMRGVIIPKGGIRKSDVVF